MDKSYIIKKSDVFIVICLVAVFEMIFGYIRVAYIEETNWGGNLSESGKRHAYLDSLSSAGLVGREKAREYALMWFHMKPSYGLFFVLDNRYLWDDHTQIEIRTLFGEPQVKEQNYDAWIISYENHPSNYIVVEYEDNIFARIGLVGDYGTARIPAESFPHNQPYLLSGDYTSIQW